MEDEQKQGFDKAQQEEERVMMAVVKPKKRRSLKRNLLYVGTACLALGLGVGSSLAIFTPLGYKLYSRGEEMPSKVTYVDAIDTDDVVVSIGEQIGPCIVSVYNNKKVSATDLIYYAADAKGEVLSGLGSGIIFKEDENNYYIVTNSHVVEGADSLAVNFLGDIKAECQLVGKDSENDVAVVKVNKALISSEEKKTIGIAPLGDSSLVKTGQLAVAIGTPAADALNNTVTRGIISAAQRTITIAGLTMTVIQTDAAINPGNSGGALVGPTGEVIGMNVAKTINTEGIGFAIPINIVKPIAEDLMVNGSVVRPALGITGVAITQSSASIYDLPIGVYIHSVMTGGSADLAGIKTGDILIQFDGKTITTMEQLKQLIAKKRVGDLVEVKIIRDQKQKKLTLALKEMPAQ